MKTARIFCRAGAGVATMKAMPSSIDEREELHALLRPAAGGLYLFSTGRAEQLALQRMIYGAKDEGEVDEKWKDALARIERAKVVVLGVPSDVGAGFRRGANLGPQALRSALLADDPNAYHRMHDRGVVDIGDVFVVPQLLHDEMLSEAQKEASRRALYPGLPEAIAARLPVSPLSILERALDLVFALNPAVPWCWAAIIRRVARVRVSPAHGVSGWGIVQVDAHTDLLEERLGVRYCFATWSLHASRLLESPDRMVQVGLRASRHERGDWEQPTGVRQLWADECNADPDATLDGIVRHLEARGVESVYFSNDIDGTDERFADATGTPEPNGLTPDFVASLIRRLGQRFRLRAADVMEVAPPLELSPGGRERTLETAIRYLRETLDQALGAG